MKWASFVVLAASLAVLVGCGKGSFSKTENAATANVFRYPMPDAPTTIDPARVEDGDTIDLLQQTVEGLVGWSEDNKPTPMLATSWDLQDGGKTYIFHLKKGVKFTNGREMHADDFKWCIERACNPKFNSNTAPEYLNDIVGVNDRLKGKASEVSGVQVVDPYTLKIQIDAPKPYFLGKLTYPVAFVYAKEAIPDPGSEMTDVKQLVGTGPFIFSQYAPGQLCTLVANKDYHEGAPLLAKIERPIVKDPSTRLNMFKKGDLDLVQLAREDLPGVQQDAQLKNQLQYFDRPAMWYIGLNCGVAPFNDVRIRQAVAQAINVDEIVQTTLGGVNKKADGILPPAVLGHRTNAAVWNYNPDAARKLLAAAGHANGQGLPDLTIRFRASLPDIRLVAEKVATDLKQNLNMTVTLQEMEWRSYLELNNTGKMPFFHMRWGADYLDPQNFLSTLLASYGPENHVNYANPQFDALCRKADSDLNQDERLKLYAQAEDIALKDAPFVPIYFQRDIELISPRVKGIRESVFGHLPHTKVHLE